jgi:hypothetical protein
MGSKSQIPGEITALLQRWGSGDPEALGALAEMAYGELRAIAAGYLRHEAPGFRLSTSGRCTPSSSITFSVALAKRPPSFWDSALPRWTATCNLLEAGCIVGCARSRPDPFGLDRRSQAQSNASPVPVRSGDVGSATADVIGSSPDAASPIHVARVQEKNLICGGRAINVSY